MLASHVFDANTRLNDPERRSKSGHQMVNNIAFPGREALKQRTTNDLRWTTRRETRRARLTPLNARG
jgi:hypothetical protein